MSELDWKHFDTNLHMNPLGPIPRREDVDAGPPPRLYHYPHAQVQPHDQPSIQRSRSEDESPAIRPDESFNLLGPLDNVDDTDAALDRIFGNGMQGEDHVELDPTLASAAAAAAAAAGSSSGGGLGDDDGRSGDDSTPQQSHKRKATSRANMLARGGACEFCKRRKLKCSAELPSCAACLRGGKECIYAQKKQRSRVRILEDRLIELEKRLENKNSLHGDASTAYISPATSDDARSTMHLLPEDTGFTLSSFDQSDLEPDLMTLAHAAEADGVYGSRRWDTLAPNEIAREIIKAAEGGKGLGERIVAHLLQLYVSPPSIPALHYAVPPNSLLGRMSAGSTNPPHPALLLSLAPALLPLSPSLAKHAHEVEPILAMASRTHAAAAIAMADSRLLDVIAARTLDSLRGFDRAQFLVGWAEVSSIVSLCWGTGLGKMQGIGERFVGAAPGSNRAERVRNEVRARLVARRGMICAPPASPKDLGDRINLFWQVYLIDKLGCLGWAFTSVFIDDEIATPLPKAEYESIESLRDNTSLSDFMAGNANSGRTDSNLCMHVKAIALYYKAMRLYEILTDPVEVAKQTANLLSLTRGYMASLPMLHLHPVGAGEVALDTAALNETWMLLHTTMSQLHAREAMTAELAGQAAQTAASFAAEIASAEKVVEGIDFIYASGDFGFSGYDLCSICSWYTLGRSIYNLTLRFEAEGDRVRAPRLRAIAQRLVKALSDLGKKTHCAHVVSQTLENVGMNQHTKLGEWLRVDNME